jgi:HAD superfamily hydrolase (TIGR01509 family)
MREIIMNFKKYKYAIMDYDGTLLDSMHYWRTALSRCVKNLGLEPKEDLDKRARTLNHIESLEFVKNEYNLDLSLKEIEDKIIDDLYENYSKLRLKEGAIRLLDILKENNIKIIILSATTTPLLYKSLKENNILSYFDKILSSSEIGLSKKDERPFLYALEEIGGNINNTIVFEDSLYAIKGAVMAGFDICGIMDDESEKDFDEIKKRTISFSRLKDVPYEKESSIN